jgi:hypothetical protein
MTVAAPRPPDPEPQKGHAMRLPSDWTAEKASGWWSLHHLKHDPCGFETPNAYDLWGEGPFGENAVRQVVYGHRCDEEN